MRTWAIDFPHKPGGSWTVEREVARVAAACDLRAFRYIAFPSAEFDPVPIIPLPEPEPAEVASIIAAPQPEAAPIASAAPSPEPEPIPGPETNSDPVAPAP